jgi:hypothetical protein
MITNVGLVDRILRVIVGVGLIVAALMVDHPYAWAGWVGVVPLLTGLVGHCPVYRLFGLRTCPLQHG